METDYATIEQIDGCAHFHQWSPKNIDLPRFVRAIFWLNCFISDHLGITSFKIYAWWEDDSPIFPATKAGEKSKVGPTTASQERRGWRRQFLQSKACLFQFLGGLGKVKARPAFSVPREQILKWKRLRFPHLQVLETSKAGKTSTVSQLWQLVARKLVLLKSFNHAPFLCNVLHTFGGKNKVNTMRAQKRWQAISLFPWLFARTKGALSGAKWGRGEGRADRRENCAQSAGEKLLSALFFCHIFS